MAAGTASAQSDPTRQLERAIRSADQSWRLMVDPNLDIAERSQLDVGGSFSFFFLNLNDSDGNHRRLIQPEFQLYGRASIDGVHNFFVRGRFQYRDFSPGDSFDDRGDRWTTPFLDRYVYEYDHAASVRAYQGKTSDWNFNIKVGRQFVDWGEGLVLSEALYAVRPTLTFGRWEVQALAGVTPADRSITDFDSTRAGFDDDTKRGYFGGLVGYRFQNANRLFGYFLHMQDFNDDSDPRDSFAPLNLGDVDFEYNANYAGIGFEGTIGRNFVWLGEATYQFGSNQSDPLQGDQSSEDISAWAGRLMGTYLLLDPWQTRLQGEFLIASGDDDRLTTTSGTIGGNKPGTDDNAFNSLGFVNTGLAFSPTLSNLITARVGIATFPFNSIQAFEQLQLGVDFLIHSKYESDAPIEEETTDDSYLGSEVDFSVNYRITSDLAAIFRYGVFFPGEAIATETEVRHFIFTGFTLSF
ncbi:MAG: alginate export family protein [Phycisphaerales bacterium]